MTSTSGDPMHVNPATGMPYGYSGFYADPDAYARFTAGYWQPTTTTTPKRPLDAFQLLVLGGAVGAALLLSRKKR